MWLFYAGARGFQVITFPLRVEYDENIKDVKHGIFVRDINLVVSG